MLGVRRELTFDSSAKAVVAVREMPYRDATIRYRPRRIRELLHLREKSLVDVTGIVVSVGSSCLKTGSRFGAYKHVIADGDLVVSVYEQQEGVSMRDIMLGTIVHLHNVKIVSGDGRSLQLDNDTVIVDIGQLSRE
ncbi:hypothetical protein KIPB_010834 [Kipferlia bialata]|uniref:Uncharacterized protein n=1 Tax=Kipferlia bialata TaxID=797122 RepID=A0A9K3GMM3_9EUKA|nr:hypothetical protein KIPB_010834 [Kipferlia bialata]|eukprot:g10834.t1